MSPHTPTIPRLARRLLALAAVHALLLAPARPQAQGPADDAAVTRLADAVCRKELVVLGELPSHGEARGFQAKARIVERLVTTCGFDAVLFEGTIHEFLAFERAVAADSATPAQLDNAIGRFWLTKELRDFRGWLFRQATARTLLVGGLDDQVNVTSTHSRATLPKLVAASLPPERAAECEATVARHLNWTYGANQRFDAAEKARLAGCARDAADAAAARVRKDAVSFEQVMLENFAGYVGRQKSAADGRERDEAMYRNLLWHVGRMPKGSKVIVWTATTHAARRQGPIAWLPLGARIAARWKDRAAIVGFTAHTGESSMAGLPVKPLPETPEGSLERRATAGVGGWALLDARALRKMGAVPSRLLGTVSSADWSTFFDHVLAIREETAATRDW